MAQSLNCFAATCVALLTGTAASNAHPPRSHLAEKVTPACLRVMSQARDDGVGYDHIVRLLNQCRADAHCDVATNVSPQSVTVDIPRHKEVDVVTFHGAPTRHFTPRVSCRLRV